MEEESVTSSSKKHVKYSSSTDREEEEEEEDEEDYEISFLEACMECDDDALYDIIRDGVTREQINERDKSGRTGLSHASANGFMPILELLGSLEDLDPNLADNDGNTALIYASQAGHDDVVNYLLHNVRNVRVDQSNKMGFTALMKAAIQGRTRCAKLLLFAGASPNKRDHGRGLCAEEWARFCGCHSCAASIAKYVRSKKYFFKKYFLLSKDKWSSEPDLLNCSKREKPTSWIQRHLSLKKAKARGQANNKNQISPNPSVALTGGANKFGSAPILLVDSFEEDVDRVATNHHHHHRRPSCFDDVVPVSIGPRRTTTSGDEGGDGNSSFVKGPDCDSPSAPDEDVGDLSLHSFRDHQHHHHHHHYHHQPHHHRDHQERPPKITVGDPACEHPQPIVGSAALTERSAGAVVPGKAGLLRY